MTVPNYEIFTPSIVVSDAMVWCKKHFGKQWRSQKNPQGTWIVIGPDEPPARNDYRWYFRNEKDAMLFTLRWS
jgi:hypothetical protein